MLRQAVHSLLARRWMLVLAVYLLSRVFSTTLLAIVYLVADAQDLAFASPRRDPSLFTFMGSWDASFYKRIAETGYPAELPLDDSGHVLPNEWAFLPLFPLIVRPLMLITGAPFYPLAVLVATVCGFFAALALHNLLALRTTPTAAIWAVALFCFGPLGFLLQVAYAESLFFALCFASLWALVRRRYVLLTGLAVVAAFARPGALAIALALGIHFLLRSFSREPFPWRDRLLVIAGGLLISAAGLSWPLIAGAATGRPDAYLETELAWWAPLVGRQEFAPLTPWFALAGRYLGIVGVILVIGVLAAFVFLLTRRSTLKLGSEIVSFSASYGLYLFAVFLPQQSTLRLLMPLAPLLGAETLTATRARRWTALAIGAALQPVAIWFLWFLGFP